MKSSSKYERVNTESDNQDDEGRRGTLSMRRINATATKEALAIKGAVEFPEAEVNRHYHCTNIGITFPRCVIQD